MFHQHYQALFRDGECFLHVVSLLNGNLDEANGERLVLVVLQTLTCLLARNDASKVFLIPFFSLLPCSLVILKMAFNFMCKNFRCIDLFNHNLLFMAILGNCFLLSFF